MCKQGYEMSESQNAARAFSSMQPGVGGQLLAYIIIFRAHLANYAAWEGTEKLTDDIAPLDSKLTFKQAIGSSLGCITA